MKRLDPFYGSLQVFFPLRQCVAGRAQRCFSTHIFDSNIFTFQTVMLRKGGRWILYMCFKVIEKCAALYGVKDFTYETPF